MAKGSRDSTSRRAAVEVIGPGLVAGWLGALAMLVVAGIHSALVGLGPLWPLARVGDALVGTAAGGGAAVALLGLLLHLIVAGVWGVLFNAALPRGVSTKGAFVLGLLYGVFVFAVMNWLVLPWMASPLFHGVSNTTVLLYNLLFGAVVPLALPLRRSAAAHSQPGSRRVHA